MPMTVVRVLRGGAGFLPGLGAVQRAEVSNNIVGR